MLLHSQSSVFLTETCRTQLCAHTVTSLFRGGMPIATFSATTRNETTKQLHWLHYEKGDFRIRASVDALCRDGAGEISRDPRIKRY